MMQVEHLLTFFDPGFNGLPAVVVGKLVRQVFGNRIAAEVEQGAVLDGFTGVKTLQSDIYGVRVSFESRLLPGSHFGVGAHPFLGRLFDPSWRAALPLGPRHAPDEGWAGSPPPRFSAKRANGCS